MTHNELKERRKLLSSETQKTLSNMKIIKTETERVQSVAHNAESILDDLDAQFEEKTGFELLSTIPSKLIKSPLINSSIIYFISGKLLK